MIIINPDNIQTLPTPNLSAINPTDNIEIIFPIPFRNEKNEFTMHQFFFYS